MTVTSESWYTFDSLRNDKWDYAGSTQAPATSSILLSRLYFSSTVFEYSVSRVDKSTQTSEEVYIQLSTRLGECGVELALELFLKSSEAVPQVYLKGASDIQDN